MKLYKVYELYDLEFSGTSTLGVNYVLAKNIIKVSEKYPDAVKIKQVKWKIEII